MRYGTNVQNTPLVSSHAEMVMMKPNTTTMVSNGMKRHRTIERSGGRAAGRSDGRAVGRSEGRTVGRSDGRTVGRTVGRSDGRTVNFESEFTFIGQFRFGLYIYRLIPNRNFHLSVNFDSEFTFVG